MNIKDLQNIDAAEIVHFLRSRLDIAVVVILAGISFISVTGIFSYTRAVTAKLRQQIEADRRLVSVAEEQKRLISEINRFKEDFPEHLDSNALIDRLSSLAIEHRVQITSLSPAETRADELQSTSTIQITINATDYENIISFTKSIESLSYSITIHKWDGSLSAQGGRSRQSRRITGAAEADDEPVISVQMTINSIMLRSNV
jgi:Tfp pilus assembly protein PilO